MHNSSQLFLSEGSVDDEHSWKVLRKIQKNRGTCGKNILSKNKLKVMVAPRLLTVLAFHNIL